jgi:hypothetical protein
MGRADELPKGKIPSSHCALPKSLLRSLPIKNFDSYPTHSACCLPVIKKEKKRIVSHDTDLRIPATGQNIIFFK